MDYMSIQDQLDIWGQILGRSVSVGQTFTNFLRVDKHPGAFLREYSNVVFLTDYAAPEFNTYTCIHAVKELMGCTLTQAATNVYASIYLNKPLSFNISTIIGNKQKGRKSGIRIHFMPWTKNKIPTYTRWDKEYWDGTEVTFQDLKESHIFSIHHFFLNDKMIIPKYPTYGYYRPDTTHVKIHQTQESKENRFLGTTGIKDIWEFNVDQKKTLLTKSVKDALILSKQLPQWKVVSFNNEGTFPEYPNIDLILFDNDPSGIKAANRAAIKYNAETIYFTSAKDSYDVIKEHGIKTLKLELQKLIK